MTMHAETRNIKQQVTRIGGLRNNKEGEQWGLCDLIWERRQGEGSSLGKGCKFGKKRGNGE